MYGPCCTFDVKSILNPLNVAFNDEFRKIFNIARHTNLRLIINGFINVLPVSLTVVCNLSCMIQNMLMIDNFQQLLSHLFFMFDCSYDLSNLYNINIRMCKLKLSKSYNN